MTAEKLLLLISVQLELSVNKRRWVLRVAGPTWTVLNMSTHLFMTKERINRDIKHVDFISN